MGKWLSWAQVAWCDGGQSVLPNCASYAFCAHLVWDFWNRIAQRAWLPFWAGRSLEICAGVCECPGERERVLVLLRPGRIAPALMAGGDLFGRASLKGEYGC